MKTPLLAAAAVAFVCVLASSVARADEPPAAAPADGIAPAVSAVPSYHLRDPELESTQKRWYGWQTLMVDGISLVTSPVGVGLPGLVLGAPIVHLAHHQYTAAAASFTLRAAGAGAVALWAASGSNRGDFAALAVLAKAIAGGVLVHSVVTALDAAVFAYDDRPSARRYDAKRSTTRVVPTGGPDGAGGATLGLAGTF